MIITIHIFVLLKKPLHLMLLRLKKYQLDGLQMIVII